DLQYFALEAAVAKGHALEMDLIDAGRHVLTRLVALDWVTACLPRHFFCRRRNHARTPRKSGKSHCACENLAGHFGTLGKRGVTRTPAMPIFPQPGHKKAAAVQKLCRIAPNRPKSGRIVGRRMARPVRGPENYG